MFAVFIHNVLSNFAYLPHPTSPYKGEDIPLLCKEGIGEVDNKSKSANIYDVLYSSNVVRASASTPTEVRPNNNVVDLFGSLFTIIFFPVKMLYELGLEIYNLGAEAVAANGGAEAFMRSTRTVVNASEEVEPSLPYFRMMRGH